MLPTAQRYFLQSYLPKVPAIYAFEDGSETAVLSTEYHHS
jgi:hypothetical protein